jgi:hypothetical protein
MALQPEELFGDAVSQTPNLRAYPSQDGVQPGRLAALSSDASVAHLTPLQYDASTGYHSIWSGASGGTNEVDTITAAATTATDGTFTLTVHGQTTDPIDHDADAATIQAALEALSNVASGDVAVVDSGGGLAANDGVATLTWGGAYASFDVELSADFSALVGDAHVLAEDTPGVVANAEIDALLWAPDEAHAGLNAGETLIQRFVDGLVHHDDVPLPAGEAQAVLTASLKSSLLRQKGITVQGVAGVA